MKIENKSIPDPGKMCGAQPYFLKNILILKEYFILKNILILKEYFILKNILYNGKISVFENRAKFMGISSRHHKFNQ